MDDINPKASFTRTVNVTVFVNGTFDFSMDTLMDRMGVEPILPVKVS